MFSLFEASGCHDVHRITIVDHHTTQVCGADFIHSCTLHLVTRTPQTDRYWHCLSNALRNDVPSATADITPHSRHETSRLPTSPIPRSTTCLPSPDGQARPPMPPRGLVSSLPPQTTSRPRSWSSSGRRRSFFSHLGRTGFRCSSGQCRRDCLDRRQSYHVYLSLFRL